MSSERVFIVGGTGNIGTRCVKDLLENNVAVTLYARNPDKVNSLFPNSGDLLKIVQGDLNDLTPIEEAVKGHTRLFLLVSDFSKFAKIKGTIAKYAYAAGVKQIVDISSFTINAGWRTSEIGSHHYYGEKAIFDIPDRGYLVALRPGRFMSNLFRDAPIKNGAIFDNYDSDEVHGYISTEDIGAVAAVVLREDIHKHGDTVYTLIGQVISGAQRAEALTRVLGKEIKHQKIPAATLYKRLSAIGLFPHSILIGLCSGLNVEIERTVTPCIEILLGRPPQTIEEYLTQYKALIK